MKLNLIDGRFDVIGTGFLLGVKGYGKEPKSVPVGSETVMDMYPLDFEEFLWTCGITAPIIETLKENLKTETPVPEALHNRMRQLLLQYVVVGGNIKSTKTILKHPEKYHVNQAIKLGDYNYNFEMRIAWSGFFELKYKRRLARKPNNCLT